MEKESVAANSARIYEICSIVADIFIPLIGIILGILAITNARKGVNATDEKQVKKAKMGMTLGIIGLVLALVLWIVNLFILYGR